MSDAAYWRKAYEDLVDQTGRDLNDGLGIDPRRADRPATSGRSALSRSPAPSVVLDAAAEHLRETYGAPYGLDHPKDRERIEYLYTHKHAVEGR